MIIEPDEYDRMWEELKRVENHVEEYEWTIQTVVNKRASKDITRDVHNFIDEIKDYIRQEDGGRMGTNSRIKRFIRDETDEWIEYYENKKEQFQSDVLQRRYAKLITFFEEIRDATL